jgi:hypothetical protein
MILNNFIYIYIYIYGLNLKRRIFDNILYEVDCNGLERVFYKFPKYHMKILLGDFNVKVGREDIFKPTIGMKVYSK